MKGLLILIVFLFGIMIYNTKNQENYTCKKNNKTDYRYASMSTTTKIKNINNTKYRS